VIKLLFPGLPISDNQLYQYNKSTCGRFLSLEAKSYKAEILRETKYQLFDTDTSELRNKKLKLNIVVYSDTWVNERQGKIKKIDIHNLSKALIDSIFEALEMDDSFVWEVNMRKADIITTKQTEVTIETLD